MVCDDVLLRMYLYWCFSVECWSVWRILVFDRERWCLIMCVMSHGECTGAYWCMIKVLYGECWCLMLGLMICVMSCGECTRAKWCRVEVGMENVNRR